MNSLRSDPKLATFMAKVNEISDLSLTMSPTECSTLREHLQNSESEERYPQCNYNSTTATASIRMTPPGPLHEKVAEQCLIEAIALRTTLPKEHLSRISVQPSTIFKGSNGPYSGSRKTPDLVILARDSNSNSNNTNNNNEMLLRVIFEIAFKIESEFGPVVYKDLHWTGKISTAFFEILTLDPLTRLATKSGERTISTLFDISPDKETQSFISVEAIRQGISESLIPLGHSRCFDKVEEHLKNKHKNPGFKNDSTSPNVLSDTSLSGLSIMNSQLSLWNKLNRGTSFGTKHQAFNPKRHFSLSRDKTHRDVFLRLDYPGLQIWRIKNQLSLKGAHQVFQSGGFSTMYQTRIPSSYRNIDQKRIPQLIKRTPHWAVTGYALRYHVRVTDQAIKKAVLVCSPRNPVRLLGVLAMVVSFGSLGGCMH